ncbi:MAG: AraC family transcriptional regulator [Proteobacteria bacterium]|nr:AraC family transcriptional regulator [Pseudomonadota bacterium]
MREPTISAGFARALMELAIKKGANAEELAARSRIHPESLLDQDNRIPFAKFKALMRAGKELTGDPALALHFGEAYNIAELSIAGLIGQTCETMVEAFAQLGRYQRLAADFDVDDSSGERFMLVREHGEIWLVDTRKDPNEFPEITESSFARTASAARALQDGTRILKAIHFTHPEPSYRAEYDRVFQLPLTFESERNALLLTDASFLALKFPNPSRYAFGVLSERAEALLEQLKSSKTTRGRVEGLLVPILHVGDASIETVATKMGLSRQTIYRNLKAEGTSFEKVLDELRHKMSLNYLSNKKVSVNETAYLVGFSEPAAFSRAFKRWTGKSPREMRALKIDDERIEAS